MSEYIISCCSTVDLPPEYLEKIRVQSVPFHYAVDGQWYKEGQDESVPMEAFYRAMEEGAETNTSQVNAEEYRGHFLRFLQQGKDILHITLSGGLSGTVNSARIAAEMLRESFPERRIEVIDSLSASSGYGMLVDKAAELRDGGMPLEEVAGWIEENRLRLQHWFFSTSLKYYVRGGRISRAAGLVGGMLGICPLLRMDEMGKLVPVERVRTKRKVREAIVKKMSEMADKLTETGKCFISHSGCPEDAHAVAELVGNMYRKLQVQIFEVGTVIGSHTGPGTVALFFWGKHRSEYKG